MNRSLAAITTGKTSNRVSGDVYNEHGGIRGMGVGVMMCAAGKYPFTTQRNKHSFSKNPIYTTLI
jgi:hypothetical protein